MEVGITYVTVFQIMLNLGKTIAKFKLLDLCSLLARIIFLVSIADNKKDFQKEFVYHRELELYIYKS